MIVIDRKRLVLKSNGLERIPDSIIAIKGLEMLQIASNRIESLPEKFALRSLTIFEAPDNRIERIPATFHLCERLERVNLSGNPLEPGFWTHMSKLPRLRSLLPQTQDKS